MKNKKSADSKIEFSFENIHFSCEGENEWVEKQLNNMLSRIPALLSVHKKSENVVGDVIDVKEEDVNEVSNTASPAKKFSAGKAMRDHFIAKRPKTAKVPKVKVVKVSKEKKVVDSPLSQFISDKKATNNQVRKFLATAVFVAKSDNITKLSTTMVSKALKSSGIEKLQNASDCLNKNAKKGYFIKDGREFIITENGYLSIE